MEGRFEIVMAARYGMCFGVRDALEAAEAAAKSGPVTVLGQLVHNEVVRKRMQGLGAREGDLWARGAETENVVVTAHGAADRDRERWKAAGYRVTDTTCPLVHKAHNALAQLVAAGCAPVVIGKRDHVEVRGLSGDFPGSQVVLTEADVEQLEFAPVFGVVSQTTQPIERVREVVAMIRRRHPAARVEFRDTVCQPTKARQDALRDLCRTVDLVLVVGGSNSNNSWQLVEKARTLGCRAERVGGPGEVVEDWLRGARRVGVTAGTSTLEETVGKVVRRLEVLGGLQADPGHGSEVDRKRDGGSVQRDVAGTVGGETPTAAGSRSKP